MTQPSHLVELRHLFWSYARSKQSVFKDFSFVLHDRDFCIVQWKSWCGKTTLVKMLTGYLKPPRKSVFFESDDLARLSAHERQSLRRRIGTVYQENKLLDHANVRDNVCYPLQLYGYHDQEICERFEQVSEEVGIAHKATHIVRFLSWWEKQKVAIARAIIHKPDVLIADEPTGNLDHHTSESIADLFIRINQQWTTVLFITHNSSLVNYISTKHSVRHCQL